MIYILFIFASGIGLALAYIAWRYWHDQLRLRPEDEEFQARIAELNEHQANRLSDDQIRAMLDADDAWNQMVRRGRQQRRRNRRQ